MAVILFGGVTGPRCHLTARLCEAAKEVMIEVAAAHEGSGNFGGGEMTPPVQGGGFTLSPCASRPIPLPVANRTIARHGPGLWGRRLLAAFPKMFVFQVFSGLRQ
ncbi:MULTISPECIES: hypothetical protein [unclassified Mesorhizobium]|uniref:hypothetical protein n=1 Tax=unclassified Mesorhizobium TaxID=325217 RepID=UPI001093E096|nr:MULTISPECIES: hypothetical protein [unclassified Mesorhizobium]TIT44305.1 MAG: hypothetical protein E5W76_03090 [Mesorhizobium sp.]